MTKPRLPAIKTPTAVGSLAGSAMLPLLVTLLLSLPGLI
jgi:hypothetical protein